MFTVQEVKQKHPIEHVIEADLGPPIRRSRGKLFWRCPFHPDKAPSFVVYPDDGGFHCFGCLASGDVLDYIQRRDKVGFKGAFRTLAGADPPPPNGRAGKRERVIAVAEPPSEDWQARAWQVMVDCAAELWTPVGDRARAWLRNERGLTGETLQRWWIGFNHADGRDVSWRRGLKLRRGVVVPIWHEAGNWVWRLKVRRPVGSPKYMMAWPDGSAFLWGVDSLPGKNVAFLCESEFDGLLLWQEAGDLVAVVGQGGAGEAQARNVDTWLPYLLPVKRLFVATDNDDAGQRAAEYWMACTKRARRVLPPAGATDLTDAWRAGVDLRGWVQEILEKAR